MKVIKKLKNTVLLQDETGFMFHVPTEIYEMEDESLYEENMIPHSISFDLVIKEMVDDIAVQKELYAQGIHTVEDILGRRKAVNDILKRHINAEKIVQKVKKS